MQSEARRWADDQFGHAELGDRRRTARLVDLAEDVIRRPTGIVSRACVTSASREGAFRWLENGKIRPDAVRDAVIERTMAQCRSEGTVIVPIDGSSLSIEDANNAKGLGGVGAWYCGGSGVQAMTALAVTLDGTPVGICGQEMWTRSKSPLRPRLRAGKNGEYRYWNELLRSVNARFIDDAPLSRPWFQMDRGADGWETLKLASELGALVTIRATHDRPLQTGGHLWSALERAPVRAKRQIRVPARPPLRRKKRIDGERISYWTSKRRARVASLDIRSAAVVLSIAQKREGISINAVRVRERGRSKDPIEWVLLTTHPIRTRADVLAIVHAYALRWRIEDFHRAWKSGLCRVEETQLRSRNAIYKWATILAAVATRAMRLTMLARETPDALATTEFTHYELQAIIAQRRPKGVTFDVIPTLTLGQAVRWMADTAGYNGPWKGPPGVQIIGRGLEYTLVIAHAFESRDKM